MSKYGIICVWKSLLHGQLYEHTGHSKTYKHVLDCVSTNKSTTGSYGWINPMILMHGSWTHNRNKTKHNKTILIFYELHSIPHGLSNNHCNPMINFDKICAAISWWRHQLEAFSTLLAFCAGYSPVTGEIPAQRPVTRSFDVFLDLRLKQQLS